MTADEMVERWIRRKLRGTYNGFDAHERQFGCTIKISNVRAGLVSEGYCSTCYHQYPAILFDARCNCPLVPQRRNPNKMRANPNRINLKDVDIAGEFNLQDILADMLADDAERTE